MMRRVIGMLAVAALGCGAASARDLPVPPEKGWQHARTGLILPASLAGLPRTRLADATDGEFDVSASFARPDDPVFATVYLFQPSVASVPIWFERAEWMIEHRDAFGSAVPASAAPTAFAPPGAVAGAPASAMRRSYAPTRGRFKGTALAVVPLGEWLVAVRMSSSTLAPAALDAKLTDVLAAIRWPARPDGAAGAAAPIPACPAPLAYGKAKLKEDKGEGSLMALILGAAAHDPKVLATAKARPVAWCRDPGESEKFAVYRADTGPHAGYTLALADAGRTINVSPTLDAMTGKDESYTVTFEGVDGRTTSYASFVGLPSPEQAMKLVVQGRASGNSSGDGRTVTINSASFSK